MDTINSLKRALRLEVEVLQLSHKCPLSDAQYRAGFNIFLQDSGWMTYQDFIFPQLCQLLTFYFKSRTNISVLEIGPGPKSVLGYLPEYLRRIVKKYSAFESNCLFATRLEEWLRSEANPPLPCLTDLPKVHRMPFTAAVDGENGAKDEERYDVILFCHSMYGMKPKHVYISRALEMLVEQPRHGMVVVFHRDRSLHLNGMVCHRIATFPTGVLRVRNNDETLNSFAAFVAGFVLQNENMDQAIQDRWRAVCRKLGRREDCDPDYLWFSCPNVMVSFTHRMGNREELADMPLLQGNDKIKNWEARLQRPTLIFRPTEVQQVQECVRWARKHKVNLTVIGGGHSGHCLRPNVASVDMRSFDQVHVLSEQGGQDGSGTLVIAESGCKTEDIVRKTIATGLTVPLGARPSVGAGLWLQGGLGHLGRLYGLACDAIVGAVLVSVDNSQVLCVGLVPSQHWPAGAVRPENESDILWALKGAGTNFGIVISVTFRAFTAPSYLARSWVVLLSDHRDAQSKLQNFDELIAKKLPHNYSADAYLYCEAGQLRLGVTMLESGTSKCGFVTPIPIPMPLPAFLGPEKAPKCLDGVELFEHEMYMSTMHGGHGDGKTHSFKRCVFLNQIGKADITDILVTAIETRPTLYCYLHLLQGGGSINEVPAEATAFGCRGWDFACVITGVWPRDQGHTETAQSAVKWVYNVAQKLMSLSRGAYGADLGPDPRDIALAGKAFGPNWRRLARLKQSLDPHNVLAYACPLPKLKLIVLVTGESGAGKDHCAEIWASEFVRSTPKTVMARVVSISDAVKHEYAAATSADLRLLLWERSYKEQHRPALTRFFQARLRQRPQLAKEQFLNVVNNNVDVDVLFVTGMRDNAPVAHFAQLVPDRRLVEVYVQANERTRRIRLNTRDSNKIVASEKLLDHCPCLTFNNDRPGTEAARSFATNQLLPLIHEDLQRLSDMVRGVPDFPRIGTEFRHVLGIAQQSGGLILCTSLLKDHFFGNWSEIDTVACCEAGGFIYASPLAVQVGLPLTLMREAGKLPPPTVSVIKRSSHISSMTMDILTPDKSREKRIEMQRDLLSRDARVVIIDDVLSTGETLCAMLKLLTEAGIDIHNVCIMVVVEFPLHRGRQNLHRQGFGKVRIQSLLVVDGS